MDRRRSGSSREPCSMPPGMLLLLWPAMRDFSSAHPCHPADRKLVTLGQPSGWLHECKGGWEPGTTTGRWERGEQATGLHGQLQASAWHAVWQGREVYSKSGRRLGAPPASRSGLLGRRRGRYLGLGRVQVAAVRSGGLACGVETEAGTAAGTECQIPCTWVRSSALDRKTAQQVAASGAWHTARHTSITPAQPPLCSPCSVRPSAPGLLGTHLPLATAPAGSALRRCWEPTCTGVEAGATAEHHYVHGQQARSHALLAGSCLQQPQWGAAYTPPTFDPFSPAVSRTLGLPPFFSVSTILIVSSGVRS